MTDPTPTTLHPLRDFGFAPGEYLGKCRDCGQQFVGNKRASRCEPCANMTKAAASVAPAAPTKALAERLREALQGAWNDHCSDTGHFPDCFEMRGRTLTADFSRSGFAEAVARRLEDAQAAEIARLTAEVKRLDGLSDIFADQFEVERARADAAERRAQELEADAKVTTEAFHDATEGDGSGVVAKLEFALRTERVASTAIAQQLAGAREALEPLRPWSDQFYSGVAGDLSRHDIMREVERLLKAAFAALAGEAPDAGRNDLGVRALTVLAECLPLIEASEDAQLVGDEGCLWPAENALALVAEAREAGLLPAVSAAGLRAGEVG